MAQQIKNPPATQETQNMGFDLSLGGEDTLEEKIATHSSVLAWRRINPTNRGALQSIGLHRAGHDWVEAWAILGWVAISFSEGSSQPRDRTCNSWISCIGKRILYHEPLGKPDYLEVYANFKKVRYSFTVFTLKLISSQYHGLETIFWLISCFEFLWCSI